MRSTAILALFAATPATAQDLWFSLDDPSHELRSNPDVPADAKLPIRAELPREASSLKLDVPLSVEPQSKPASPNGSVSGASTPSPPTRTPSRLRIEAGTASRFRISPGPGLRHPDRDGPVWTRAGQALNPSALCHPG